MVDKRIKGNDLNVFNSSDPVALVGESDVVRGLSRFTPEVDGSPWLSIVTDEAESPSYYRRSLSSRTILLFLCAANDTTLWISIRRARGTYVRLASARF